MERARAKKKIPRKRVIILAGIVMTHATTYSVPSVILRAQAPRWGTPKKTIECERERTACKSDVCISTRWRIRRRHLLKQVHWNTLKRCALPALSNMLQFFKAMWTSTIDGHHYQYWHNNASRCRSVLLLYVKFDIKRVRLTNAL